MTPSRLLRSLKKDPGFGVLAVVTLALGLGAVVTIFTLVNSILLRGLPYPDQDRLIAIDHTATALELPTMGTSRALYLHYRENATTLDEIGIYDSYLVTLTGDGEPVRVSASSFTPSTFRVLGMPPRLGRTFVESDGEPGSADVVVLSQGLFERRFGSDSDVLGTTIPIDGVSHEIVGVMPRGFAFPQPDTELWRPRKLDPSQVQLGAFNDNAIARVTAGVPIEQARADLERLSRGLTEAFPDDTAAPILDRSDFFATVEPMIDAVVGDTRGVLWVLLGTVAVILLIACANVANLFLVRVEERSHDLAVRSALGASRGRLIRELIAESVALALLAGALGLGLAIAAVRVVKSYGPEGLPRLSEVSIDGRVVLFTLVLSVAAGAIFGLLPSLRATAGRFLQHLREGTRGTAGRERHLLRSTLVTAQVALGLVLLVASGLLVRSLERLTDVDPGFRPDDSLTFRVTLPESKYEDGPARVRFAEDLATRIAGLPGVESATVGSHAPLSGIGNGSGYALRDFPRGPDDIPPVFMTMHAGPGYLEALGVELVEGRLLVEDDHVNRRGNVVVTENIARKYWPGESALGRRISDGRSPDDGDEDWDTIVGVVRDVYHFGLDQEPPSMVFLPLLMRESRSGNDLRSSLAFLVRSEVPPDQLIPMVRSEAWSIDADIPITQVQTLRDFVRASQAQTAFSVVILSIAALLALTLASVGLYGVISYVVSRRTRELGVRMALGAERNDVTRLVLRGGVTLAVLGIGVGLGLALGVTRFLDSMLFGVGALDPVTFTVVPIVLFAVACLACLVPAYRASRVEPIEALRYE